METDDSILYSSFAHVSKIDGGDSMKRAKKLAKIPNSCVEIVEDIRTISLPWCFMNRLDDGIKIVLDKVLCSYRKKVGGVPIARSKAKIIDKYSIIIEDQPQFQFPVKYKAAVFRPRVGNKLPARVVRIDEGQIVCSVYGVITANVWKNHDNKKQRKVHSQVKVEDCVILKVLKVRLFRRLIQIDAELVRK